MEGLLKVVPFFGILALIFAAYLAAKVSRQEEGTHAHEGNRIGHQ